MPSDLFVRIKSPYDVLIPIMSRIHACCEKVIVYEHNEKSSNIHVHMYLVQCDKSTDTLKNYIRKVCDSSKGNQFWSFKTAQDAGCITYMSKGKLDPVDVKGFTQEEIDTYKSSWEDRSTQHEAQNDNKSKGPTQYDMAMEVFELVRYKISDLHTFEIYRLCVRASIQVHHKYRKGFCEHSLKKVVQTAYTKIEDCKNNFVDKMVDNFFR